MQIARTRPESYLRGNYPHVETFHHTDVSEVKKVILKLKNCSAGHDEIHSKIMKAGVDIIAPTLVQLINNSFDEGICPDTLKIAKITPIFKNGDRCDVSCYRPISILPCLSKIIERLVYDRMWHHIKNNNIICKNQFGFVKGLSIESAIIHMLQNIIPDFDNNKIVIGVFMDLSKAFDVINHDILLLKLKHYGFINNTLAWFKSYLSNRVQYTDINKCYSSRLPISLGVPQGSILGPILFSIFINDLINASNILSFLLYADDSNMFHFHVNLKELVIEINRELKNISEWFRCNKLLINMDKTHFLIFSRKRIDVNISL